jgi:type II secretory pathway pseudopilin PulG
MPSLKAMRVSKRPRASQAAFTMIEIALCLAIVGFALVAIIGVLPAGLNVQKDNREETIINEEASVWMDALRSGSFGYDQLADYVDRVVVSSQNFNADGSQASGTILTVAERNPPQLNANHKLAFGNNGALIVGLLSTPRIGAPTSEAPNAAYSTNYVYAYVRAFSGIAAEKPPQDNLDVRDLAFSYRMVVETTRVGSYDPALLYTNRVGQALGRNLQDVRLLFRWPLKESVTPNTPLDRPETGSGRLAFRSEFSGRLEPVDNTNAPNVAFYFLLPRSYQP